MLILVFSGQGPSATHRNVGSSVLQLLSRGHVPLADTPCEVWLLQMDTIFQVSDRCGAGALTDFVLYVTAPWQWVKLSQNMQLCAFFCKRTRMWVEVGILEKLRTRGWPLGVASGNE